MPPEGNVLVDLPELARKAPDRLRDIQDADGTLRIGDRLFSDRF